MVAFQSDAHCTRSRPISIIFLLRSCFSARVAARCVALIFILCREREKNKTFEDISMLIMMMHNLWSRYFLFNISQPVNNGDKVRINRVLLSQSRAPICKQRSLFSTLSSKLTCELRIRLLLAVLVLRLSLSVSLEMNYNYCFRWRLYAYNWDGCSNLTTFNVGMVVWCAWLLLLLFESWASAREKESFQQCWL